jgi:hypothetical protein
VQLKSDAAELEADAAQLEGVGLEAEIAVALQQQERKQAGAAARGEWE